MEKDLTSSTRQPREENELTKRNLCSPALAGWDGTDEKGQDRCGNSGGGHQPRTGPRDQAKTHTPTPVPSRQSGRVMPHSATPTSDKTSVAFSPSLA